MYVYENETTSVIGAKGLHICMTEKKSIITGTNVFHCKDGSYVSHSIVCDAKVDCWHDSSDEDPSLCALLETLYKTLEQQEFSVVNSSESGIFLKQKIQNHEAVLRDSGLQLNSNTNNDLIANCGPEGDDEPILVNMLQNYTTQSCLKPYELPCTTGHPKCYNITDICIYKLDNYKHLVPCRNGGHLQNCRKFECNNHFKCQGSFCISWVLVCDGKWDCPHGKEELHVTTYAENLHCFNMYKCRDARAICISLPSVCDAIYDCHLGDDEHFCQLKAIQCPLCCKCFLLAVECIQLSSDLLPLPYPHTFLSVHYSPIIGLIQVGKHFTKAQCFDLRHNKI